MTAIEARDLRLYYRLPEGVVRAVDGVSFIGERGMALGVVGESGSGKSSLGLALMRLLPRNVAAFSGQVSLNGLELVGLREEEFRRRVRWKKISMVFQRALDSLNPVMKVGHQIAEPLLLQEPGRKREAYQEASRLLEVVRLPREVFGRYPHELSGGMKQRVVLAMALVLRPQVLILDEPTSALDVSIQAQIINLVKRLLREEELFLLFITHDIAVASELCHHLIVMYAGQFIEQGRAEQVLASPGHPYTRLLLASLPALGSPQRPQFIPGTPPEPARLPSGCRFHPRCPHAFEPCPRQEPPFLLTGEGHQARCWLLK